MWTATFTTAEGDPGCLLLLLLSLIRSAKLSSPDCLLLLLPMMAILTVFPDSCWRWSGPQSSRVRTAISHYCWVRSGQRSSGVQTVLSRYCWRWSVDEFCLPVKVSPCHSLFAASENVATSQPGHRVFACSLIVPEGLGSESHWKMLAWGSGFFHEDFSQFHLVDPLKKPNFSSVWHGSLSRWLPFEHSNTKMGSLDIGPVYSTLCCSITSTHSTSKFHLNMFQYSIGGAIMLDAITYGPGLYSTDQK